MEFSARLVRAARVLANLSQVELAEEAKVAVNTIRLLEQGHTSPRTDTLEALTGALARRGVEFLPPSSNRLAGLALVRVEVAPAMRRGRK